VEAKEGPTICDALRTSSQWVLVIDGTLDGRVKSRVEALAQHIMELLVDSHLTIRKLEIGSVKIIFEGTPNGYQEIVRMNESGELATFLERSVVHLSFTSTGQAIDPRLNTEVDVQCDDDVVVVHLDRGLGQSHLELRQAIMGLLKKGTTILYLT